LTKYKTICHICKLPMDDHTKPEEDDCLDKYILNEKRKKWKGGRKNKNGNIPKS